MVTVPEIGFLRKYDIHNSMSPRLFEIKRLKRETKDTFTVELFAKESRHGFVFQPGQFNMIYIFGVGEIPISISGDPTDNSVLVHTTRVVGNVTKAMGELRRGDVLGIRGPYGNYWPLNEAEGMDIVLVAGGIGLAPLRPALYKIVEEREKYGKVVLLYGTRTPADVLFRKELEQWRARFDLEIYVTVDRAMSGWKGNVGVVTHLIQRAPFDPHNMIAYVCGPEVMMRFTAAELQKRGVSEDRIFVSLERNMKCGVGYCGHCQFGPYFVCKDGPIFRFSKVKDLIIKWEI